MSSAFTLDDTAPQLLYSSGWAIQSPDVDKSTERFLGRTYHVAIVDGATLNMSVAGTSIAVYGSVGPGHSNYSVQIDDTITPKSAYAPKPAFQQLLFEHTFPASESNQTHFVSLKAIHSLSGNWLDVDYVTVGAGGDPTNDAKSVPENTTPPPWEGVIPQGDGLDSVQGIEINSSASHSHLNRATAALSITFGILLFLALLALLAILFRRRATTSSQRFPSSSYTKGMAISLPTNFEHKLHGGPLAGQVEHSGGTPASSVCSVGILKGPGYLDGDGTALLAYAPQLHVKHSSGFAPPSPFSPPSSPPMFSPSSSPAPLLPPMSPAGPDSPASSTTRVHPYAHPLAQSHQREEGGTGVDEVVESPVHRWRQ